jgi:serine/threonine protein kinase
MSSNPRPQPDFSWNHSRHRTYRSAREKHTSTTMPRTALLQRRNPTVREIVRLGLDFLTGLHHIHLRKLLHINVKPSKVLIDSSGKAAVTNFGMAHELDRILIIGDSTDQYRARLRLAADGVCSFTDREAVMMHNRLHGTTPGSVMDLVAQ